MDVVHRLCVYKEEIKTIDCETCGGSGFSEPGTGYNAVCDDCGGQGEHPID